MKIYISSTHNSNAGAVFEHPKISTGADDRESLNPIIRCSDGQQNSRALDSDLEYINNIDLSSNIKSKEMLGLSQSDHRQQSKSDDEVSIGNSSSTFYSPRSSEKSLNTQSFARNKPILNSCIIPESDETRSSISDMFSDSVDNKVNNNSVWNKENQKLHEENNLITDNSVEVRSLVPQNNITLQKEFPELEHNLTVASNEDNSSLTSDSTIFDEEHSFRRQNSRYLCSNNHGCAFEMYKQINIQQLQVSDSNLHNKSSSLSSNQTDDDIINSLQKDSAYDTCQLYAECTPSNSILQKEDNSVLLNQETAVITPHRKDNSVNNTDDLENITNVIDRDWISGESNLSCHYKNDESINQIKICCGGNQDTLSCSENEYSQSEIDAIGNKEYESGINKKKKLEVTHETEREIPKTKKRFLERDLKEKEEKKISSEWLRFTLNALHVDDVAFQSVTVILSVLQNEKIAKQYMKKKCWKNTLEEQAVDAILNFCKVFEAENKTTCTQEIVRAVTNTLDKSIKNAELNKVTIRIYHVSIILELCNSTKVCIETINYLITKLKSYESILSDLMDGNKAEVHDTINQLHIILYALNICLQKYRLMFPNEQHSELVEEMVLSITDLRKRQLTCEDVIIEDKVEIRERRWLIVLNDFMMISVENCSLFVDKLQMLINLITRE